MFLKAGISDYEFNVRFGSILLKKSKAQPHCKTVELTSTSSINLNCRCNSI